MGEPEAPMMEAEISAEEKLAGKIAKAFKDIANKDASDQHNLKQARIALNKGNMDAAEKIAKPYLSEASKYELKVLKSSLNDALALLRKEDFNFKQINGKPADNFVIVKFTSADELQAAKEFLDTQNNRKSYLAESAVKEAKAKPMGLSKDETLKVAKPYLSEKILKQLKSK
jgi:hypothetical protein